MDQPIAHGALRAAQHGRQGTDQRTNSFWATLYLKCPFQVNFVQFFFFLCYTYRPRKLAKQRNLLSRAWSAPTSQNNHSMSSNKSLPMRDVDESEEEEASEYDASDASYGYEEDSDSGMHLDNHTDEAGPSTSGGPGWSVLNQGKKADGLSRLCIMQILTRRSYFLADAIVRLQVGAALEGLS